MKTFLNLCSVLALGLLTHCGSGESQSSGSPSASQPAPSATDHEQTVIPGENYFAVRTSEGTFEVFVEGENLALEGPGISWIGEDRGEKRKYYNPAGDIMLEVKYSDAAKFKLRNADGSLRWKIKVYDDKVKVADNEEMENPYEIRLYDGGRIKLKRDDEELAEWRISSDMANELTREGVSVSGLNGGFARGALLIEAMSLEDQLVLMAELFVR